MPQVKWIQTGALYERREYDSEAFVAPRKADREAKRSRRRDYGYEDGIRARRTFLRLANGSVPLSGVWWVTFTPWENLGLEHAWPAFRRCIDTMRVLFGKEFQYVAVVEKQKRGAFHVHAIFWGFSKHAENILAVERSSRCLAEVWGLGYVDVVRVGNSSRVVGYLSKYVAKTWAGGDRDPKWKGRRYVVSAGVERSRVVEVPSDALESLERAGLWVEEWTATFRWVYVGTVCITRYRNTQYGNSYSCGGG